MSTDAEAIARHTRGHVEVDRIPLIVARYRWTVELGNWWSTSGWAFTKRGAERAARKALEES